MKRIVLLLLLFIPAFAAETIHRFRAELWLDEAGTLEVQETIELTALGQTIRHGIYRDLVLSPDDPFARGRIRVEILEAQLDGEPVLYRTERTFKSLRVYLGDPARYLAPGRHIFSLRYRAEGAVLPGPKLFWNVTGNRWAFPIERAEVFFWTPVEPLEIAAYVGAYGSTAEVTVREVEGAYFAEARDLPPGSGLTLFARFPKGSLPENAGGDPFGLYLFGAFLLLFVYYFYVWRWRGQDPPGPPVIPRFRPPEKVSAPIARYLVELRQDDRTLVSALFDLAHRGHLVIEKTPGGYRLVPQNPDTAPLPLELRRLYHALFPSPRPLELGEEAKTALLAAKGALSDAIDQQSARYLRKNARAFALGTGITAVLLGGLAYWTSGGSFGYAVAAFIYALLVAFLGQELLKRAARAFEAYRLIPGLAPLGRLLSGVFNLFLLFLLPLPGALFTFFLVGPWSAVFVYGLLLLNAAFGYLLPAFTRKGVEARNHLLGLARYLAVTDEAELKRIGAPKDTPADLEALFPYAVALGLEAPLARRLARALARAGEAEHSEPGPRPVLTWYRGPELAGADAASLARVPSLLTQDLTRGLLAAYRHVLAPEGGSGGGFSGGGLGGGGGGGW